MTVRILVGDALEQLRTLPDQSVHVCVTSPPYFGLRDYGVFGQIGLESSPDEYVAKLVAVFREVRRVLRDDGTLWVNLGDAYANDWKWGGATGGKHPKRLHGTQIGRAKRATGLPPKSLMLMPARVALALQADCWILRSEIIWHKPSVMPESVTDRPTRSHETIYLLSKQPNYYYDAAAIMEPTSPNTHARVSQDVAAQVGSRRASGGTRADRPMKAVGRKRQEPGEGIKANDDFHDSTCLLVDRRNKRTVWTISSQPFKGAHFATFPPALVEPCILAGSSGGGVVLDPFGGAGTTGLVADRLGRDAILIELNADYAAMARRRIDGDSPLFAEVGS